MTCSVRPPLTNTLNEVTVFTTVLVKSVSILSIIYPGYTFLHCELLVGVVAIIGQVSPSSCTARKDLVYV